MHSIRINPYGCAAVAMFLLFLYLYMFTGSGPQLEGQAVSIKRLLSASIQLAYSAGLEIRRIHKLHLPLHSQSKGLTFEGAKKLITDADRASHKIILQGIHDWLPSLKVVSEETIVRSKQFDDSKVDKTPPRQSVYPILEEVENVIPHDMFVSEKDIMLWVDPLDATQEYTENLVQYVAVMVGITLNDRVIAGVVHFPFQNVTYWAWKSFGFSRSLEQLRVKAQSSTFSMASVQILISRSHAGETKKHVQQLWNSSATVKSEAGAGYKVVKVIAGEGDAYLHTAHIQKWDVCPAMALVMALQGFMTDSRGEPISCALESDSHDDLQVPQVKEKAARLPFGVFVTMHKPIMEKYLSLIRIATKVS